MKNLLKITVVSLSLLAFAQAEALVCPAGQYVYTVPGSGSVCVNNGMPGAVGPVQIPSQPIPGGFKCDGGPQVPGCGPTTSESLAQLQGELSALQNQLARANTPAQQNLFQAKISEIKAMIQVLQS